MVFRVKDFYFKEAKKKNFLARSIFKLEEIHNKFSLFKPQDRVLDLGYYPGSWTQFAHTLFDDKQKMSVIGIDIQPLNKELDRLQGVTLIQKDIFEISDLEDLGINQKDYLFDVVMSDMAPSTTGIKSIDQLKSLEMVERVFFMLPTLLKEKGNFVIKVFESQQAQIFLKSQKKHFKNIHFLRPQSTRKTSKEYFFIGIGYINLSKDK